MIMKIILALKESHYNDDDSVFEKFKKQFKRGVGGCYETGQFGKKEITLHKTFFFKNLFYQKQCKYAMYEHRGYSDQK